MIIQALAAWACVASLQAPDNNCSVGVCPCRGFRVTAIDVTPQLLAQTQAMAAECRVTVNTLSAKSAHAKLKDGQADVMTIMRESQAVLPLRDWWALGTRGIASSAVALFIFGCRREVTALPGHPCGCGTWCRYCSQCGASLLGSV